MSGERRRMLTGEKEEELEDLELLDDDVIHAACARCYPINTMKHLDKYIGICGKEGYVHQTPPGLKETDVPPNPCPDCLVVWQTHNTCPVCGFAGRK